MPGFAVLSRKLPAKGPLAVGLAKLPLKGKGTGLGKLSPLIVLSARPVTPPVGAVALAVGFAFICAVPSFSEELNCVRLSP